MSQSELSQQAGQNMGCRVVRFGFLKVVFWFDLENVLSGSRAHTDFTSFALLRDLVSSFFHCVEENSSKMAESRMKFIRSQKQTSSMEEAVQHLCCTSLLTNLQSFGN